MRAAEWAPLNASKAPAGGIKLADRLNLPPKEDMM